MAEASHNSRPGERPLSVTLVALGVFLLGIVNGWRAIVIFRQRGLLLDLGATLDPALIAAAAVVWSLLLIGAAMTIYRRWPASRWITPILLALYILYGRFLAAFKSVSFINEVSNSSVGLIGTTLFSLTIFIFVVWVLNRKAARDYFVTVE